ncbi:hypothetical protein Agabi119p4_10324 [Agaricus bisporus var. burnettii]|uniref:Uncharacterized protein n=1 Tax=Agaricus bisporus var. burnettii TaxID=192524 RepID=A0A8H7EWV5_AGABI|nr:hypothetical protein Agabi119p4_10324 [Agaricus bisporus var. burnettii]
MSTSYVQDLFSKIPADSIESDWFEPWGKTLQLLFPGEHFVCTPPFPLQIDILPIQKDEDETAPYTPFTIAFASYNPHQIVIYVDIKTRHALHNPSERADADARMRRRFSRYRKSNCASAYMTGVSAFGPRVAFYHFDRQKNDAAVLDLEKGSFYTAADTPPEGLWNIDLQQGGLDILHARLSSVVTHSVPNNTSF